MMGSRTRPSRFERDERIQPREESYGYRQGFQDEVPDSRQKMPMLQFTTDINPAIFSGPLLPTNQTNNRNQYSGNYRQENYPSDDPDRKYRRESYYEEERERSRQRDRSERDYRDSYDQRDKDRVRDRSRDRDRLARDRIRDRSYDHDDDRRERDRGLNRGDWREEIPNCTLMIRGLDTTIGETEIREEVRKCGLEPKDIRLIKEKGTGASRGFAFVEFQLLSEAVRWKELTKGTVIFRGNVRASLHYSIPKEMIGGNDQRLANKTDWDCSKCGMSNFKRRDFCFKCHSAREDQEWQQETQQQQGECYNEISNTPSNTLLFGNLDVLTTEGRVLAMLGQLTTLPIKSLRVVKDSLTNTSRGYAFVELNSTSEAIALYDLLTSMGANFYVDGRQVSVSYAKKSVTQRNNTGSTNAAIVALAAAQWTNQKQDDSYEQYYGASSTTTNEVTPTVPAAPVTTTASSSFNSKKSSKSTSEATQSAHMVSLGTVIVNGASYYKYPLPDISTYQYDDSSGYYYDPSTGLYYDANSQYYYQSETQQYLYWDGEHSTYLPVASEDEYAAANNSAVGTDNADDQDKKNKKEDKQDKVKIAKKIAKDMERWAKTLNQKKENAKLGIVLNPAPPTLPTAGAGAGSGMKHSATADAGFAILEKRTTLAERSALMAELDTKLNTGATKTTLVSYGADSDSDTEPETSESKSGGKMDESKYIDLAKMACLLCKRQFPNKDALNRHRQLSDLHKKNLAKVLGTT